MKGIKQLFLAACLSGIAATTASAQVFTFIGTPTGLTDPVSVKATFTVTGPGQLTLVLQNLTVNPKTVAQNLSDIFFSVSTGNPATFTASGSGKTVTVDASGNPTVSAAPVSFNWGTENVGGTSPLHLSDLIAGGQGPKYTIIGAPNGSGVYSNANSSIAGNSAHNPFVDQSATFVLGISGVTASTVVSDVVFSFGTAPPGSPGGGTGGGNVPTPNAALVMAASGFAGWFGFLRRRRA